MSTFITLSVSFAHRQGTDITHNITIDKKQWFNLPPSPPPRDNVFVGGTGFPVESTRGSILTPTRKRGQHGGPLLLLKKTPQTFLSTKENGR